MHAPSQIHQLRSECRTTARGNGGMRREREVEGERGGEGGRVSERAGQWLVDILPGLKPQTDREKEREEWERRGKGKTNVAHNILIYSLCRDPNQAI